MNRRLLLVAFLSTLTLTILATGHQLTNAASDMAPPPQHAPSIALMTTPVTPTWQVVAGGGSKANYLTDVSMDSPSDGWAVGSTGPGSYGVLMHFDGSTWSQTQVPTGTYIVNAVAMISSTEGWAVGYNACYAACDSGLVLHYTLTGWQRATLPPRPGGGNWSGYSYDIDIKDSTGWIVGDNQYFLQLTGSNWTPITAPLSSANAVAIADANEAWATGEYNYMTNAFNFAHYSGGAWTLVTPTLTLPPNYYPYIRSIYMLNASEGWAVGSASLSSRVAQCLMLHYTGGNWVQVSCPVDSVRLYAVHMRSSGDVWAVGQYAATSEGVVFHYNGSTWTTATMPSALPSLNSVKLVGTNDGWIVGSNGTILRLVNGTWTRVQGSNLYVGPISAVSANEIWYGGPAGQLYRWQNGTITQYTGPLTTSIQILDMISPTVGWGAVRGTSMIFRYSDGTWMWMPNITARAIDMIGPDEGWIGQLFGIWHYASGTWTYQSGPNSYGAKSLSMLDSNHGWAVSANYYYATAIVTYTNGTWAAVTPTLTLPGLYQTQYLKVIGISPSEAWVAGHSMSCTAEECPISAELDHFVGGAWTNIPMPDWRAFLDMSKVSATEWWATGKLKTSEYAFLHYKDGVFTTVPAAGEDVQQVSMLPDGTGFASGVGSVLWLHSYPYNVYLPLIRH